jgi:cytochrome b-561
MANNLMFFPRKAILVYRGFRYARKKSLKVTHATIHGLAFLFTVIGLIAAFDSHNYANPPIPNLYSLHSWIGLIAVIIFGCQYVAGFFCYLFPLTKEHVRILYMPIHIFFGLLGFILAIATCLLGISEKAFFAMPDGKYGQLPSQALLVNAIGLLTALYGSLVVYLVTEPSYKRQPLPEDQMLLTGNAE